MLEPCLVQELSLERKGLNFKIYLVKVGTKVSRFWSYSLNNVLQGSEQLLEPRFDGSGAVVGTTVSILAPASLD